MRNIELDELDEAHKRDLCKELTPTRFGQCVQFKEILDVTLKTLVKPMIECVR